MKTIVNLITLLITTNTFGQHILYTSKGEPEELSHIFNSLEFKIDHNSKALPPLTSGGGLGAAAAFAIAGPVIQTGLKIVSKTAAERKNKYSRTITLSDINTTPKLSLIPQIHVKREGYKDALTDIDQNKIPVFSFDLNPISIENNKAFYYEITNLIINLSDAKLSKKHSLLNFSCELKINGTDKEGKPTSINAGILSILYINTKNNKSIPIRTKSNIIDRFISITEVQISVVQSNSAEINFDNWISKAMGSGEEISTLFNAISENIKSDDNTTTSAK